TKAFMDYWVEFAKTGNPNLDNRVDWPLYTVSEDQHLVMDDAIVVGSGLRRQACDLFDRILEEQRKTPSPPSQD
ncbi:MAG: carboxylesterase family protein, partial [Planctomycetota bacterium]|nr:carboxylesterase family protein [Planctomycetota bacterium]